jgi:hypothetical protein
MAALPPSHKASARQARLRQGFEVDDLAEAQSA